MDWYATTSGILDAQPQYTIDGTTWINLGPQVQAVSNDFYGATPTGGPIPLVFDVSSIASANDNPNFGVRLVSAYNSLLPNITDENGTHGQYANAALVGNPPGPAPYNGSKGNWRFDNIEFHGVSISPTLPVWLSSDSQAIWDATSHTLQVSGNATIIADPGSDEPVVTVGSGGHLIVQPTNSDQVIHLGGLSLTNGGTADVKAVSNRTHDHHDVLVIGAVGGPTPVFAIDAIDGSKLDLESNDLILRYAAASRASTDATVSSLLASGITPNGDWSGTGITSSTANFDSNFGIGARALGWMDNNDIQDSSFDGVSLSDFNQVMVKFTYYGDVDLSGTFDATDVNQLIAGRSHTPGNTGWEFCDLDYDGLTSTAQDQNLFFTGRNAYQHFGAL